MTAVVEQRLRDRVLYGGMLRSWVGLPGGRSALGRAIRAFRKGCTRGTMVDVLIVFGQLFQDAIFVPGEFGGSFPFCTQSWRGLA